MPVYRSKRVRSRLHHRECGDDGCGGTCGECTGTETCELGECLDQDPPRDERALLTERVGYGSKTTGGLDGTTCHVTNRNDSGAGSLRACTQTSGARWIVFDIDGAVYLKSNIQVPSNTTIDGRGRTVRIQGSGLNLSGVSNVLLVNLIFERGNGGDDNDAITIRNGTHNVWVHHCSFSDYGDGLIDIKEAATDITVSWSYFTNHDKVMLISASTKDTQDDVIRVTLHHNWFKDTKQRHPRLRLAEYMRSTITSMHGVRMASAAATKARVGLSTISSTPIKINPLSCIRLEKTVKRGPFAPMATGY